MFNRPLVIVAVDGSRETEGTVDFAMSIARRAGADLHAVHVVSRGGGLWNAPHAETGLRERLRSLRPSAEREGLRFRIVTLRGRPESVIPAYAQLHSARLIVVERHYGSSSLWRSSRVANRLSRSSPVPVIVLPTPTRSVESPAPVSLKRIMVAVDFTVASAVALRTALDLAREHGAHLTMLHAMSWPRHMVYSGGEASRLVRSLPAEVRFITERLKRKVRAFRAGAARPLVVPGVPAHGIVEAAGSRDADLIVMGVAPRTSLDEAVFGSTLRTVLRRATTPVLVVPVVGGAEAWSDEVDGLDAWDFAGVDAAMTRFAA